MAARPAATTTDGRRPWSIRTRLLRLVLLVWLPAAAGFALIAHETYQREEAQARGAIQRQALDVRDDLDRELDKRAAVARALASSLAVRDGDLPRFRVEAGNAVAGSGDWAILAERRLQLANTQRAPAPGAPPLARIENAPFAEQGVRAAFSMPGAQGRPVIGVFVPEPHVHPPRLNVGVAFEPAVVQAIVDQLALPPLHVAAVLDDHQRIVARSRDPATWIGREATPDIAQRARERIEGFVASRTLDGVRTLAYTTTSTRYGWSVVIGLPAAALDDAVRRVSMQALGASGLLLLLGLGLALQAARRLGEPVLQLRESAAALAREQLPPVLDSGVREVDEVGAALHDAGVRRQQSTAFLQQRVAEAVYEAKQAQARLLEAQKHEAIGRLTGGIAHDFNNLLQTISVGLQVIERSTPSDGPHRRAIEASQRATRNAAALVRQLLAFTRAPQAAPKPVALAEFIERCLELARQAIGERVQVSAEVEPGLPPLRVDPSQFELAVLNLLFNARDALPQGGRVRIAGRRPRPGETDDDLPAGEFVCVDVEDDGVGMDEATLRRALDPYFTTKPVGAGSGLGLAQVHAFARQSGGTVRLHSAPGRGTRVTLLLPASSTGAAGEPDAEAAGATPAGPPPVHSLRLLVVEDDVLVAEVVVPALQAAGHQVRHAGTADEALALLAGGERFDVVFTDLVMPGKLAGTDLIAWCGAQQPPQPILAATGYSTQNVALGVPLLRKPYDVAELLQRLEEVAGGR